LTNVSNKSGALKRWPKFDISQGLNNLFEEYFNAPERHSTDKISVEDISTFEKTYKYIKETEQTAPRDA